MKRIFVLLAVVLLITLCSSAVSCADKNNLPSDTSVGDVTTAAGETGNTDGGNKILSEGKAAYTVVRSQKSNAPGIDTAIALRGELSDLYETEFTIKDDFLLNENEKPGKEILVGLTEREESREVYAALGFNQYAIKVIGDKIVLAGWNEQALAVAKFRFTDSLSGENKDRTIDGTIDVTGTVTGMLNADIPLFVGGKITQTNAVQGTTGAFTVTISATNADEYAAYITACESAGYAKVQYNETTDGTYATLSDGKTYLQVNYWKKSSEVSLLADKSKLPATLKKTAITAVTEPKVIVTGMLEGEEKGMCYVVQCSDGSYIIIDGAMGEDAYMSRLYALLVKYKPASDAKPHVRAWFLTHQHADHMNGIEVAGKSYASRIKCDAVYANMPLSTYQTAYSNYSSRYSRMTEAASKFGGEFVIFRTGQTYYFGDAEVTMLETVDDLAPFVFDSMDNTSPLISVTVGGGRMLFSGDAENQVFKKVLSRYTAASLKSIICQASSHGVNGTTPSEYYRLVSPDYYLWPATWSFYNQKTPDAYIKANALEDKIIYDGNGTSVLGIKDGKVTVIPQK